MDVENEEEPEVVAIASSDVLDLHGFAPADIPAIVRDYLDLAVARGYSAVRLIHGRGIGVQRERVRSLLAADPRVAAFGDAPGEAGGWGATCITLKPAAAGRDEPERG